MANHPPSNQFYPQPGFAPRAASQIRFKKRYLGPILASAFIVEGLVVKSFVFTGNDPIILHYAASTLLCGAIILYLLVRKALTNLSVFQMVLLGAALSWSIVSSINSDRIENLVASITFGLAFFTAYIAVPRLFERTNTSLENVIRSLLIAFTVISLVMAILFPSLATDAGSGRFSGAAISVAVACNMFFFSTVVFAFSARAASNTRDRILYVALTLAAFGMLYITYTRSLLVLTTFCLFIILITNKNGYLVTRNLFIAALIGLSIAGVGLAYEAVFGFDYEQLLINLRLIDGASVTTSRDTNWAFAIQRISDEPLFGEGMLTKQTAGGFNSLDIETAAGYAVTYDPHSVILSFGVQAGVPFAFFMTSFFVLVFATHLYKFGFSPSLASAPFMVGFFNFVTMIFSGGDLTSMGSSVDRFNMLFIGIIGYNAMFTPAPKSKKVYYGQSNGKH